MFREYVLLEDNVIDVIPEDVGLDDSIAILAITYPKMQKDSLEEPNEQSI